MTEDSLMEIDLVAKPETSTAKDEIRGVPKSGRWWKTTQKQRLVYPIVEFIKHVESIYTNN